MRGACIGCLVSALWACGGDDGTPPGDGSMVAGWSTGAFVANGPVQETAAAAVAGKIYVIGGFDSDDGIVARVQVYDTATGTWSDGPALPREVHHANVATDGTTIYVLGALVGTNFAPIGDVFSLAPETETQWTTRTAMPGTRARGAAVADFVDGKIYVAGGFRGGASSDFVDEYDPVTQMWTELPSLPAPRDHACGGTIDGALYVASGRTAQISSPQPQVWRFDPSLGMWSERAAIPTARGGTGCGVIDGTLYVTGGEGNGADPSGVFANVEAYSASANAWTQLPAMPNPKHGVGGAVWDGALYLCGGADVAGFGAIADTDIFRP